MYCRPSANVGFTEEDNEPDHRGFGSVDLNEHEHDKHFKGAISMENNFSLCRHFNCSDIVLDLTVEKISPNRFNANAFNGFMATNEDTNTKSTINRPCKDDITSGSCTNETFLDISLEKDANVPTQNGALSLFDFTVHFNTVRSI